MIAVLGLGYIGLTVALGFAEMGEKVYGVETDEFRADLIRRGKIPYFEPGLDDALARHLNDSFYVLEDIDDVPNGVDTFFVCIGTPKLREGVLDYTKMFQSIDDILDTGFDDYFTICIKTHMLPGTMENVILPHFDSIGAVPGDDFGVALCPEYIREGKSWDDFINPSRIILGVDNKRDEEILTRHFEPFGAPIKSVSYRTSEFIRYLTSTLLATMISYSNEMAQVAKDLGGIDIQEAFGILQMDRRWADNTMRGYVYPGCGFGGVNLPKDTRDFIRLAEQCGSEVPLLETVYAVNEDIPSKVCAEIAAKTTKDQVLGICGLTFKEGAGDVRNSASAKIIDRLIKMGYTNIIAYDPIANDDFATVYKQPISYAFGMCEICDRADVLVIATPWRQFSKLPELAKGKTIIDCRYMLKA